MSNERPVGKFPLNIDADRVPVDHDGRSLREGSGFRDNHRWDLRPRDTGPEVSQKPDSSS